MHIVRIFNVENRTSVGSLDLIDEEASETKWKLTLEHIEKWWCLGGVANRTAVWVQGRQRWSLT